MSDKLPSWVEELRKTEPDKTVSKTKKRTARPKAKPTAKKASLTQSQMMILAGLALALCLICAGMMGVIYLNRDILWGAPSQEMAAVPPVADTSIPPTPTTTDTPTATPPAATPTSMLPTAKATTEPSPTATYAVAPEFINKDKITEITGFVEEWRQLSLPEEMPINFLTRRQLREQWGETSFDKAALEAVQTQQEFYNALGLIEPDVDLVQAALDTQIDILLGYYAPEEKVMYIIAESVNMFAQEEMTFAHEYVHALQDYHFDLSAFLNNREASGDTLLAIRSLPEGDARLVEDIFTWQNITQDQINYTVYRYLFQEHPQLEGVSPALGIFTYFPYTAGEYFVIYLFIEGGFSWDRVNQAYSNPPISSEQVMHPEKYLAGEAPVPITLPDLAPALDDTWYELDRNVLGEAGFLVWLVDQVEDQIAIDGAAGWDGDAYTLWIDDANHRLLAESSLWETEADAIEFFEAFNAYMNLREGDQARYEEAGIYFWEYEAGVTFLSRRGRRILIIIAPDRTILDGVRSQFTEF